MSDEGRPAESARWAAWREQTPALREYAYMNSGFSGPSRLAVHEAVRRRLDLELAHGATTRRALDDRHELVNRYRETMGRLFGGASPDEVAVTGNTTEGINIVVSGLGLGPGDCIVTTSVEHGSGIVPAYVQRERRGCEVVIAPLDARDSARQATEGIVAAIEGGSSSSTGRRRRDISPSTCARAGSTSTRSPPTSGSAAPRASGLSTSARS